MDKKIYKFKCPVCNFIIQDSIYYVKCPICGYVIEFPIINDELNNEKVADGT